MRFRGSKLLKHFIQLIFIAAALFTALSRISDYKHHPTDVLAGSILGTAVAIFVCCCLSDLFKRKFNGVLPR
jgi:phosphatidate phosphatase